MPDADYAFCTTTHTSHCPSRSLHGTVLHMWQFHALFVLHRLGSELEGKEGETESVAYFYL